MPAALCSASILPNARHEHLYVPSLQLIQAHAGERKHGKLQRPRAA